MLDTSVIVDLAQIDTSALPHASSIAAITLAEMTVGIVSAPDARKLGDRISVLQTIESLFQVVSFDAAGARAYGRSTSRRVPRDKSLAVDERSIFLLRQRHFLEIFHCTRATPPTSQASPVSYASFPYNR